MDRAATKSGPRYDRSPMCCRRLILGYLGLGLYLTNPTTTGQIIKTRPLLHYADESFCHVSGHFISNGLFSLRRSDLVIRDSAIVTGVKINPV
jgi:hypothetical protein